MRKSLQFLIGAIMMGLVGCFNNKTTSNSQTVPTTDTNYVSTSLADSQRIKTINVFIKCMDSIATIVNDPEVTKIAQFIKDCKIAAVPTSAGIRHIEPITQNPYYFTIVTLNSEDTLLSSYWNKTAHYQAAAFFDAANRCMVTNTFFSMSNEWKGICLLHEGFHGMGSCLYQRHTENLDQFAEEEYNAHTLQNRIMLKLGGKDYEKLIEKEKQRVKDLIKGKDKSIVITQIFRGKNYPELEKIFGKTESQTEADFRNTGFWAHAMFSLIEEMFPDQSRQMKINFFKAVYTGHGIV